ncbi:hypothetical protein MRX96_041771 [Rhipicephalus microplus]
MFRTYNAAAMTALVVFAFLAYALTQVVVKLSANKHRTQSIYYGSGLVHGGTLLNVMDRGVVQYLNLRYAKVPERFGRSVPYVAKSTGVEMLGHSQPCVRGAYGAFPSHPFSLSEQFEDCLFLNVWTPLRGRGDDDIAARPVVVVLVGGNFVSGGSGDYELFDGSVMASLWNQVIVIPNYRVGMLGFYTTGGDNTTRDAGLADQVLALEWVRTHISDYGGDPKKVTLFGHEAGATAVGLHLSSPTSSALFDRAILLSGSPLRPMPKHGESIIRDISHDLLCSDETSPPDVAVDVTPCLKTKSIRSLLEHQRSVTLGGAVAVFNPSFGKSAVDMNRRSSQELQGETADAAFERRKDILVGTTENEGSAYTSTLLAFYGVEHEADLDRKTAAQILHTYLRHHGVRVDEKILETFLQRDKSSSAVRALSHAIGNFVVHCPLKRFLESYTRSDPSRSARANVYAYYFRHVPDFRWWPYWMGAPQMLDWIYLSGNLQGLRSEKINIGDTEILLSKKAGQFIVLLRTDREGLPFGDACQEWEGVITNAFIGAERTHNSAIRVLKGTQVQLQQLQRDDKEEMSNASGGGDAVPLAITRLNVGGRRVPMWATYLTRFIRDNNLQRLNWSNID